MTGKTAGLVCAFVMLITASAGCSLVERALPDGARAPFTTGRLLYAPGDSVQLHLSNFYDQQIGYNLCSSQLERHVNGSWERVPENRVCTMELRLLDQGEEATYVIVLPEPLAAGQYRYTTNVVSMEDTKEPPGDDGRLATNVFEVRD